MCKNSSIPQYRLFQLWGDFDVDSVLFKFIIQLCRSGLLSYPLYRQRNMSPFKYKIESQKSFKLITEGTRIQEKERIYLVKVQKKKKEHPSEGLTLQHQGNQIGQETQNIPEDHPVKNRSSSNSDKNLIII